tara:strand:- start:648 stop:866 length:219 start_codon:yes stop_codon:yes gene_type:complete
MKTMKERLIEAVKRSEDDSLERAEHCFGGMPDELLNKEYGQGGRTRREILDGYRKKRREYMELLEYVKGLPG